MRAAAKQEWQERKEKFDQINQEKFIPELQEKYIKPKNEKTKE